MTKTADTISLATARVILGIMREQGMTQPQLAEMTGITPRTVQRLLAGESQINLSHLLQMAQALKEDPDEIYGRGFTLAHKIAAES